MSQGSQVKSKIRKYQFVAARVLADGICKNRRSVIAVVSLSVLSLASQFGALGLAALYVAEVQNDGPRFGILGGVPPESPLLIGGVACAVLLLLAVSAVGEYGAKRVCVVVRRRYTEQSIELVLSALKRASDISEVARFDLSGRSDPRRAIYKALKGYAMTNGRVVFVALQAVLPTLMAVAGSIILVIVDPWTTLALLGLAILSLRYQARASVRAAAINQEWEKSEAALPKVYRSEIDRIRGDSRTRTATAKYEDASDAVLALPPVRRNLQARADRLLILAKSGLIGNLTLVAAVLVLFISIGYQAQGEGVSWSATLLFFMVLHRTFVGLKGTMTAVTNVNRFYSQVRRFYEIVDLLVGPRDGATRRPRNES